MQPKKANTCLNLDLDETPVTHTNDYCFLDTHSAHTINPSTLPAQWNKRDFDSEILIIFKL